MMLLQRYLATTILSTIGLVIIALVGVETFILFVGQLGDLGNGDYGVLKALQYVVFNIPQKVYMLFPMSSLLGVLLGLGMLASHSELIVMRSAGVSLSDIALTILKVAVFLLIFTTFIGECIAPSFSKMAEDLKQAATTSGQAINTLHGTWIRDRQFFIHIQLFTRGERLEGVSRYQFDDNHHLVKASYAKNGYYRAPNWMMEGVSESEITPTQVKSTYYPKASWHLILNPTILRNTVSDPDTMSLYQLHQIIHYHEKTGSDPGAFKLFFYKRLFQPLATCVMMLLAIPFIFGPLRTVTMGVRIVTAIVAGFGFYITNEFFGPMSLVLQFPPLIAAFLPLLIFASIGVWLLKRAR